MVMQDYQNHRCPSRKNGAAKRVDSRGGRGYFPGGIAALAEGLQDSLEARLILLVRDDERLLRYVGSPLRRAGIFQDSPYPGDGASLPAAGDLELDGPFQRPDGMDRREQENGAEKKGQCPEKDSGFHAASIEASSKYQALHPKQIPF